MPNPTSEPPPGGDQQRAESYIKQIIQLLTDNKLIATHTDLTKFDPSALQDHYRIDIKNYQLEISHSKQPATGKDIYVLLFINSPSVDDFYNAHGIIAYLVLNDDQFKRFKTIADEQIETRRKVEEEKRFAKAVKPIEELLEKIAKGEGDAAKSENSPTEDKGESDKPTPEAVTPPPPHVEVSKPEPEQKEEKPLPTLADVQEAMHQAAQESAPKPAAQTNEPSADEPKQDHSLDIPQVVTLPTEPAPTTQPAPPEPEPTFIPNQPVEASTPPPDLSNPEPAPVPEPTPAKPPASEPQQSAMGLPLGNVLTESMPTGSQALPPSGIDQAIDQAFQSNGNNSITPQTPPIGIN